jgi:hypothetical protein
MSTELPEPNTGPAPPAPRVVIACPTCMAPVELPPNPPTLSDPPHNCPHCGGFVPDDRLLTFTPPPPPSAEPDEPVGEAANEPGEETTPIENQKVSRGALFRSLGGMVAERGILNK